VLDHLITSPAAAGLRNLRHNADERRVFSSHVKTSEGAADMQVDFDAGPARRAGTGDAATI
jgi:hypothetical protein